MANWAVCPEGSSTRTVADAVVSVALQLQAGAAGCSGACGNTSTGAEIVTAGASIDISPIGPQQQAQCSMAQSLAVQGIAASAGSAPSRMPSTSATDWMKVFNAFIVS